ncbi:hypothetical protein KFK09_025023 [Dendrobium nobile]|uniref:Uncharacterized protein n=1 Tax=Dendrobium nobile TaxID=94219 RepID=A0A8T3AEV5_DENNO|nr:hypothetical protein KFK09_025023 [Dendrobium nobile]
MVVDDVLAKEPVIGLYVFCSSVEDGVISESNGRGIVAVEIDGLIVGSLKIGKQALEPNGVGCGCCEGPVFGLSGGAGYGSLLLDGPRDQGVAEKRAISGCGFAGDWVAGPVGVRVCTKTQV